MAARTSETRSNLESETSPHIELSCTPHTSNWQLRGHFLWSTFSLIVTYHSLPALSCLKTYALCSPEYLSVAPNFSDLGQTAGFGLWFHLPRCHFSTWYCATATSSPRPRTPRPTENFAGEAKSDSGKPPAGFVGGQPGWKYQKTKSEIA